MKMRYPSPLMCEIREIEIDKILKYNHAILMLALTPNKDIVVVRDLYHTSLWKNFWESVSDDTPYNRVNLVIDENENPDLVSRLAKNIILGLHYIIAKGYLFLGLLHLSPNVFYNDILMTGLFAKKKNKPFINMQKNFREKGIYPKVDHDTLEVVFIGKGDKFINLEYPFKQIPKISEKYKGTLSGVVGVQAEERNIYFAILAHNMTQESTVEDIKIDFEARNSLYILQKEGKFIPLGGFKLDYGIWGIKNLKQWDALTLIPNFEEDLNLYNEYIQALINNRQIPLKVEGELHIFSSNLKLHKIEDKKKKMMDVEELLKRSEALDRSTEELEKEINKKIIEDAIKSAEEEKIIEPTPEAGAAAESVKAIKPKAPISKVKLSKPSLSKLKVPPPPGEVKVEEEDYEDIFAQSAQDLISHEGKNVLTEDQLSEQIIYGASQMLEEEIGSAVDLKYMSEEDIFKDLESSLEALSKLNEIAKKENAISRIYYPPPTLISRADRGGMEIGGSICVLSMGTGRNLYMFPELKRMQMYGKFYKESDLHDQIEDFEAIYEKDISTLEELEEILHKTFINIKRNSRIFLGTIEIEGNGFESDPGFNFNMDKETMRQLMEIHAQRRETMEFPELKQNYIDVQYFGSPEVIEFLANPEAQGTLEIAAETQIDPRYSKAIIGGIICTDFEAVYMYVLVDNFDQLDNEEVNFKINEKTLSTMMRMISHANLTPVSWFRINFGFEGFRVLKFWDSLKDSAIFSMIVERYNYYIAKLLKVKEREDQIKEKIVNKYEEITRLVENLENKFEQSGIHVCKRCGEEIPEGSEYCPSCGAKVD